MRLGVLAVPIGPAAGQGLFFWWLLDMREEMHIFSPTGKVAVGGIPSVSG